MKPPLIALLPLVACLLLAACGSTESDAPANTAGQDGAGMESQPADAMTGASESDGQEDRAAAATDVPAVPEGSNVGERIPAFYIRDASETKITSEEIFAKGRPSFFYFFTTW